MFIEDLRTRLPAGACHGEREGKGAGEGRERQGHTESWARSRCAREVRPREAPAPRCPQRALDLSGNEAVAVCLTCAAVTWQQLQGGDTDAMDTCSACGLQGRVTHGLAEQLASVASVHAAHGEHGARRGQVGGEERWHSAAQEWRWRALYCLPCVQHRLPPRLAPLLPLCAPRVR